MKIETILFGVDAPHWWLAVMSAVWFLITLSWVSPSFLHLPDVANHPHRTFWIVFGAIACGINLGRLYRLGG